MDGCTVVTQNGKLGKIIASNMSLCLAHNGNFQYFKNCYGIKSLRDEPFFEPGDSGAGVYLICNSTKTLKALGMVFASSHMMTAVCRLKPIVEIFDITPCLDIELQENINFEKI